MIPVAAQKIVTLIRNKVTRPNLPDLLPIGSHSTRKYLRWGEGCICPMGMLPEAKNTTPSCWEDLPIDDLWGSEIRAFADWWDAQTDPKQAVDEVWGPNDNSRNP